MRQGFQTSELQSELEQRLGFCLRRLVRLDGASSLNFKAERMSDGMLFAVKCSPVSRQMMFDRLVAHLDETRNTKAVKRLFEKECSGVFRGYNLICLSWCVGERCFPDELTSDQLKNFLDDYRIFSVAMQRATGVASHEPLQAWRNGALAGCRGLSGWCLRRLIANEIPEGSVIYDKNRLKVIHGDFHHGNFLFVDGKVNGFLDLEEFCEGYPAEDIVRYFVCAAEHLKWFDVVRRRRLILRFADAVSYLPYAKDEWMLALNGLLIRKLFMKIDNGRIGLLRAFNLLWRSNLYRVMKEMVSACE